MGEYGFFGFGDDDGSDAYRMEHRPADPEGGAPLYDLTARGIYPADIYSPMGGLYYGHGQDRAEDEAVVRLAAAYRGKPAGRVKIYRAIQKIPSRAEELHELEKLRAQWMRRGQPRNAPFSSYDMLVATMERIAAMPETAAPSPTFRAGDWVTIWKPYAAQHARYFEGRGKVITKTVRADELWTDGNSIYEFGYWPRA
jgi:hypothetical protein